MISCVHQHSFVFIYAHEHLLIYVCLVNFTFDKCSSTLHELVYFLSEQVYFHNIMECYDFCRSRNKWWWYLYNELLWVRVKLDWAMFVGPPRKAFSYPFFEFYEYTITLEIWVQNFDLTQLTCFDLVCFMYGVYSLCKFWPIWLTCFYFSLNMITNLLIWMQSVVFCSICPSINLV